MPIPPTESTGSRRLVTCIGYSFEGEANGRPCVLKEDGHYRMWYCYRSIIDYRTDTVEELPDRLCRVGERRGLDAARSPGGDWLF